MEIVCVGVVVEVVERELVAVMVGVGLPVTEQVEVKEAVLVALREPVCVGAYRTCQGEM